MISQFFIWGRYGIGLSMFVLIGKFVFGKSILSCE